MIVVCRRNDCRQDICWYNHYIRKGQNDRRHDVCRCIVCGRNDCRRNDMLFYLRAVCLVTLDVIESSDVQRAEASTTTVGTAFSPTKTPVQMRLCPSWLTTEKNSIFNKFVNSSRKPVLNFDVNELHSKHFYSPSN